uniref:Epidermal growth factor receptor substrate 15-like 1 n=1 Tax=Strigamia maritima TaxID=126957 RepID=T1IH15_STRMM
MAARPSLSQIAGSHLDLFEAYFQQEDKAKNSAIGALDAAKFLKKSGLPDTVLSRIWDLSDPTGKGYLDKQGFYTALKLISLAQNNCEMDLTGVTAEVPPPKMGDPPPVLPANEDWNIKLAERLKFEQLFESLGPVNGMLPGNKVKPVMMNSKLAVDLLGRVWELSDIDNDGFLDREEFILAMHLIYQALENHPVPTTLPSDLVPPSKREKKVLAGSVQVLPVSAPPTDGGWASFPPPGSASPETDVVNVTNSSVSVTEVSWVVSAADKSHYDVMFKAADLDVDGFVNGAEIKDLGLCDTKQTGKLNTEQFALAMHFVQNKLKGIEVPQSLTPDMIPPSMRPKPSIDGTGDAGSTSIYNNPELDMITKEIEELLTEKKLLEKDVYSKNTEISMKRSDLKTLQTELETLAAAIKQLDTQKGEAQKRLDDLDVQKSSLDLTMCEVRRQLEEESDEVNKLKELAEEQEKSICEQEKDLNSKRQELNDLRQEETKLEQQIEGGKNQLNVLTKNMQDSQLHITQAKNKMNQMQEQNKRLQDLVLQYDSAISSGDVSSISDVSLQVITPVLSDADYQKLANTATSSPQSIRSEFSAGTGDEQEDPFKSKDPFTNVNGFSHDPFTEDDPFKNEDPFSNVEAPSLPDPFGGKDPFAAVFGQNTPDVNASFAAFPAQAVPSGKTDPFDPFGLSTSDTKSENSVSNGDPFGGDPFAPPPVAPRSESPTPALPPKKSKQPPPRPAPPKSSGIRAPRSAPPAPDPFVGAAVNTNKTNDTFGAFNNEPFDPFNNASSAAKDPFASSGEENSDQFADFANFDK